MGKQSGHILLFYFREGRSTIEAHEKLYEGYDDNAPKKRES